MTADNAVGLARVAVTNFAVDVDLPANALEFSLDPGAPTGATVDPANGLFTWTAPANQASSTNAVIVRVVDNGVPSLSDTTTFNIVVISPPAIESISGTAGGVVLIWSALEGWTYRVQYKSDLNEPTWTDLPDDVIATGSIATKTDSLISTPQRYYRVVLLLQP